MSVDLARDRLDWLRRSVAEGDVHTVRAGWSDRLGGWRGKRLPADSFLAGPDRRVGFCDGMIVVDVMCDIIQTTPFSNFDTGYPDMYWRPRLETTSPVGWVAGEAFVLGTLEDHDGEPLPVAPRNVLDGVVARLARQGIAAAATIGLRGRLMYDRERSLALLPGGTGLGETHPGVLRSAAEGLIRSGVPVRTVSGDSNGAFRLGLEATDAVTAAEHAFLAKAALKEVARQRGITATFMTLLSDDAPASVLSIELELEGVEELDVARLAAARSALRALQQPSINAFKIGPPAIPRVDSKNGSVTVFVGGVSSEADPVTVIAAELAAIGAAVGAEGELEGAAPESLAEAARELGAHGWVSEWLGTPFCDNSVPLLIHEAESFAAAITDWEFDRYWSAG